MSLVNRLNKLTEHQSRFKTSPDFKMSKDIKRQYQNPEEWQNANARLTEIQQTMIELVGEYLEIVDKADPSSSLLFWRDKVATSFRTGINNMSEVQAGFEQELKQSKFWKRILK